MEQVGFTLERTLKRLGIARGVRERMALVLWAEVVGPAAARNTRPVLIRRGELLVQASSSAWAQELTLMRRQLADRLNTRIGDEVVREIRFAVEPALRQGPGRREAPEEAALPGEKGEGAAAAGQVQAPAEWQREGAELEGALGSGAAHKWWRVRRAAAHRRERLLGRGWKKCALCGGWGDPAAPGGRVSDLPFICPTCRHGGAVERVEQAAGALGRSPWLTAGELCDRVPGLRPEELRLARSAAAGRLREELRRLAASLMESGPGADWSAWRARAQELVLLATGLPLAAIGEAETREALGELLPLWEAAGRAAAPGRKNAEG